MTSAAVPSTAASAPPRPSRAGDRGAGPAGAGPEQGVGGLADEIDTAAQALFAVFEAAREQARTRLSSSQLQALLLVERDEGLNLRSLADGLGVLLSSASRLCDRLIAAGMLGREASAVDRREVTLTLTPSGRQLLGQLRADRRRRLDAVLARMAPAARAAMLRGLREFTRASGRAGIVELSA